MEKDGAESKGRAEALALELRERKQEPFLLEQRMQRMDTIAKEQRVRPPRPAPLPAEHWLNHHAVHCTMQWKGLVGPIWCTRWQLATC